MKNLITFFLFVGLLMVTIACSKSDNPTPDNQKSQKVLKSSGWIVSLYEDKGKDETHHFSGYSLNFGDDHSLVVSNGSKTFTGTWSILQSSDDSQSGEKLMLLISGNEVMDDLQDDWLIMELSNDFIRLADDNQSHTEFLELRQQN